MGKASDSWIDAKDAADQKAALKVDLESQLEAGLKEQANKLDQSKKHLVSMLETVGEKYLTVNGYMQVRSTIGQAMFGEESTGAEADLACSIASDISILAIELAEKVEKTDVMDIGEDLLEGYLTKDFISTKFAFEDVVYQLLVVQLLQNVGPSIDEIVQWREGTNEGIENIRKELLALEEKPELKPVS